MALRTRFPSADVAAMVAAHPPLLSMEPEQLAAAVAAVQEAFPEASQVRAGVNAVALWRCLPSRSV